MFAIIISTIVMYSVVLLLVALGGMFAERSGIINIALEGIMIIGALVGAISLASLPASMNPFLKVLIVFLASGISGAVYSLLLSFASINMKADQTIGGTALNVLATALAIVVAKQFNARSNGQYTNPNIVYETNQQSLFINIRSLQFNVFLPLAILIITFACIFLYRTKWGLRLRSCGENPSASDSVGINVTKYRYLGTTISGVLGGLGGAAYCLVNASRWNFTAGVCGFGFLALAVMIFGQWKPLKILLAALFFATFKTIAVVYSQIPLLQKLGLSKNIYEMLPYIASMIVLAFTSKKSRAPKAEGIPYDKGQR